MGSGGSGVLQAFPKLEPLPVVLPHNKYLTFCCQKGKRAQPGRRPASLSGGLFPPNAAEMIHGRPKTTAGRHGRTGNVYSQSGSRQTRGFPERPGTKLKLERSGFPFPRARER